MPTALSSSAKDKDAGESRTENESMEVMMGFSGFGKKAAKQFNVEDMFEKAKRTAMELSSSRNKGTEWARIQNKFLFYELLCLPTTVYHLLRHLISKVAS